MQRLFNDDDDDDENDNLYATDFSQCDYLLSTDGTDSTDIASGTSVISGISVHPWVIKEYTMRENSVIRVIC